MVTLVYHSGKVEILTELPDKLPANLKELWCTGNNLTALPKLPTGLKRLDVESNLQLSALPELPAD